MKITSMIAGVGIIGDGDRLRTVAASFVHCCDILNGV